MRKRAKFNLSNFHNCTCKLGQLYPVHLQEVLPGDTIQMSQSIFMRLAPMVAPVMHPTYMFCHTFYVPSRVIANFMHDFDQLNQGYAPEFNFEDFITGGSDGNNSMTVPVARIVKSGTDLGLADAFGIPIQNLASDSDGFRVNALPFAAYYLIYNEYYRDQDLQRQYGLSYNPLHSAWSFGYVENEKYFGLTGAQLLQPCWSKDYFTTARPWPQKGPQITIPVQAAGGGITGTVSINSDGQPMKFYPSDNSELVGSILSSSQQDEGGSPSMTTLFEPDNFRGQNYPNFNGELVYAGSGLSASFSSTTPGGIGSIDVSDFREAMALQRFEEHRSLFGSRYEDYLRYLGVRPQDARLQLPEYLGGFTAPVQFSEVLQTSAGETGGVGDLYGHGISAARGRRIRRFIPEHGYIMSIMCVRPIPVYAQGLERLWSKKTKEDFWQKELEHIGQQEVLNSEVYADGTEDDGNTFGFQNRYDEYRRGVNIVSGEFRTNQDFWTLARIFDNRPALNADFVECNPSDRIFQVGEQNSDQLYCMVKNNVIAKRLVSKNGNPI